MEENSIYFNDRVVYLPNIVVEYLVDHDNSLKIYWKFIKRLWIIVRFYQTHKECKEFNIDGFG